ncbi:hypothetical protein ACRW0B_17480 [Escherichia coli]|uniref:Uncharacterized protein n=1 Tax=Escherichia coli TaxID=562 RepID=A0A8S7RQQ6_ECOLX|nr:hypothetical protein [Escherichia coli]EEW4836594.1 hypothetical protein [Escherichia coli]EEW7668702.1 hypothetical protein [Escherichia coli]EEZ9086928.1 hypothetical protein [Escherichia coli]EFH3675780.1 hypothetical protein [Escherichia coli]EFL9794151.1 hypothetical protein [Escherichia coli]
MQFISFYPSLTHIFELSKIAHLYKIQQGGGEDSEDAKRTTPSSVD